MRGFTLWLIIGCMGFASTVFAQDHKLNYQDPSRVKVTIPQQSSPDQIDSVRLMNQDILEFLREQQIVDANLRTNQMVFEKQLAESRDRKWGLFWYLLFATPIAAAYIYWRLHRIPRQIEQASPFPKREQSELLNNVIYVLPREQALYHECPTITGYQEALPVEQSLMVKK